LPGFNAKAVAEHVLAMTLSLTRRVTETTLKMKAGQKLRSVDFLAEGLEGKTIGLIGQGNIAREVARKFVGAFDCTILVYSPTSPAERWTSKDPDGVVIPHRRVDLSELLSQSHVVSLHCPVTSDTRHIIDKAALAKMQPNSVLVNIGRGSLVDEAALLEALQGERLAGAALDCFEVEVSSACNAAWRP
jgi:phosphoglycerate dehydrogenase-like enzyme